MPMFKYLCPHCNEINDVGLDKYRDIRECIYCNEEYECKGNSYIEEAPIMKMRGYKNMGYVASTSGKNAKPREPSIEYLTGEKDKDD